MTDRSSSFDVSKPAASNAPSAPRTPALATLDDVRREIDRIDASMHQLLIERSAVISDLIAIKKVQPPADGDMSRRSTAFRPAREASMMRDIVERHTGLLPVDTVESIWRVIISTFTYVQAPYDVIYAQGSNMLAMRDSARFHFGYTVPLSAVDSPSHVLSSVGTRGDALGVIPLASEKQTGAWWQALEDDAAPNVIARLPFVERDDHPAGTPCLVVANAPIDRAVMASTVISVHLADGVDVQTVSLPEGVDVLAQRGSAMLVSTVGEDALNALETSAFVARVVTVGSHAPVFRSSTA